MSLELQTFRKAEAAARRRRRRCGLLASVLLLAASCPGCMIVQVGVTNPLSDVRSVAVVPFFNQSDEKAVDGRQLANLYASELQKIPGVEVIPVGVVQTAMRQHQLENLSGPSDAAKLAKILNADAVVIGSVTEFNPYRPPRVGLSIAWYAPNGGRFAFDLPVDPSAQTRLRHVVRQQMFEEARARRTRVEQRLAAMLSSLGPSGYSTDGSYCPNCPSEIQSRDDDVHTWKPTDREPSCHCGPNCDCDGDCACSPVSGSECKGCSPLKPVPDPAYRVPMKKTMLPPLAPPSEPRPQQKDGVTMRGQSPSVGAPSNDGMMATTTANTFRPIMSYTKVFDSADSATTAAFRDYLELRGDSRAGSWEARLQWADEFPRFAMHMMIVEMFQLHGGQARRRVVWKWRKFK